MPIEPVKPHEIAQAKLRGLPDNVMSCWNSLIAKHYDGLESVIKQDDAIEALVKATNCESRLVVFENKWLDIEPVFEAVGWQVTYDRPAWNESYPATFTFRPTGKTIAA